MAGNKFKEEPEEQEPEVTDETVDSAEEEQEPAKESRAKKKKRSGNFFKFISVLNVVDKNRIVHAMPFVLFLTLLAMVYIANSFYAEGTIRDIDKTKKALKEKRAEFIATKSKLMLNSMQSKVAQHAAASAIDIKESTVPPKKIIVDEQESKN